VLFTKANVVKLTESKTKDLFLNDLFEVNESKFKEGKYSQEEYEYYKKYIEDNTYEIFNKMFMLFHHFERANQGYILKADLLRLRQAWTHLNWPVIAFSRPSNEEYPDAFNNYAKEFLITLREQESVGTKADKKFLEDLKISIQNMISY
jgi:hypothetical protein